MTAAQIIQKLPYQSPFLFVDEIEEVDQEGITGCYTLKTDEYFYKGHFKEHPITPGVILTEIMAQIGLVSFGIFLLGESTNQEEIQVAMTNTSIDFHTPVVPGEKVTVTAKKVYFRFHKLKCEVKLWSANQTLIAKGVIAGMLINKT